MSRAELRRLSLRNTSEIDGGALIPLNHPPGSDTRLSFDRLVLGMSEARLPGAISYVRADAVDDSVRVLSIDGKAPSDPGYPLK